MADNLVEASAPIAAPHVFDGATYDAQRTPTVFKVLEAVAIGTEATVWTPATGKKFRLMGGIVSIGTAAGNVVFRDNTGGSTIFVLPNTPLNTAIQFDLGNGILSGAVNRVLTADGAATATISGTIWGTEE